MADVARIESYVGGRPRPVISTSMRRKSPNPLFLGVDIGGTKVAVGLVDSRGTILARSRSPMAANRQSQDGLQSVTDAIDTLLRDRRAKAAQAIGISIPGWVDASHKILLGATNIPCWHNFPLAREVTKRYGMPARIENDANAAALAEAVWGAGASYRNVFYVTLGTGVGTGFVVSGKIYSGATGAGGEGGHVTIDFRGPLCGCGKRGCIEAYASGTAIARRARELLSERAANGSRTLALAHGKVEDVTSEIVSAAAAEGDQFAIDVLNEAAGRLGIWLGTIIDLLEPEVIVLGGGVGHVMASRIEQIRQSLETWAISPRWRDIPIVEARYGSESAIVGAAALCLSKRQRQSAALRK